jgi:hypothetical protein
MGTLQYSADYMESTCNWQRKFRLPVRMASQSTLERFNQPGLRAKFREQGILFPDYLFSTS